MAKRVLIALTVDDDVETDDLALTVSPGSDATVWEWKAFWLDADDGVITPHRDTTATEPADLND